MLEDARSIDMALSPMPGVTMLIVQDLTPWPEPDSDERLEKFKAKLTSYAAYVVGTRFQDDHPSADKAKVVISVMAVTPPSARMKAIKNVVTPGNPGYEILVRFTEDAAPSPPGAKKPWWKFW